MYLKDGTDHTAIEIAHHMAYPIAAVRRVINAAHGCPYGLRCDQVSRESFSRDYPDMQKGYHKVWVYGPDRDTLRKKLLGQMCPKCGAPLRTDRPRQVCGVECDAEAAQVRCGGCGCMHIPQSGSHLPGPLCRDCKQMAERCEG